MKKILFGMFALALSASITSCNDKKAEAPAAPDNADSTEQVAQPAQPANDATDLAAIVEKMKNEGANWTEEEWRENFKLALLAMKPTLVKMKEIGDKLGTGPDAAKEYEEFVNSDESKNFDKLLKEIDQIAEQNPIGKKVLDDREWAKKFMQENGIPDL